MICQSQIVADRTRISLIDEDENGEAYVVDASMTAQGEFEVESDEETA